MKFVSRAKAAPAFLTGSALWLAYALLTFFAHQPNTYKLTGLQMFSLQLTIVIPVLFIWLVAIYGAVRFRQYAQLIKPSPDGQALDLITTGLFVLILSFITQSLLGVLRSYALGTPLLSPTIFLYNHLPLILSLVAFGFIFAGSAKLGSLVQAPISSQKLLAVLLPYTVAVALFSAHFHSHLGHVVINGMPNFILPGNLPFYTMALPYLVVWLLGLLSIVNIANYIRYVKGAIYKLSLRYLALGIVAVIAFTALLQLLTLAATALTKMALGPLLLFIYMLLIMYSLGFVLIALGAKKLTRIEVAR